MKKRMSPAQERFPEDDFRIVQSWAEYEEDTAKTPEYRNLKFLCYELEVMNPETGERTHFYKAVKFARVHRLPANASACMLRNMNTSVRKTAADRIR